MQYSELVNNATHLKLAIEQKTAHISEINRDLVNTNKKLLSNEEARKNVMSNVSHDLRTPITAIRGYAELLLKGGQTLSDEQRDTYLNNILKRSQQMERIVSDIVEISKMESTNFDDPDSLSYFQRSMISAGVIDALRKAGIQEGDTVKIGPLEFDFVE